MKSWKTFPLRPSLFSRQANRARKDLENNGIRKTWALTRFYSALFGGKQTASGRFRSTFPLFKNAGGIPWTHGKEARSNFGHWSKGRKLSSQQMTASSWRQRCSGFCMHRLDYCYTRKSVRLAELFFYYYFLYFILFVCFFSAVFVTFRAFWRALHRDDFPDADGPPTPMILMECLSCAQRKN